MHGGLNVSMLSVDHVASCVEKQLEMLFIITFYFSTALMSSLWSVKIGLHRKLEIKCLLIT